MIVRNEKRDALNSRAQPKKMTLPFFTIFFFLEGVYFSKKKTLYELYS